MNRISRYDLRALNQYDPLSPIGPSPIMPKPVAEKFISPPNRSSLPSLKEILVSEDTRSPNLPENPPALKLTCLTKSILIKDKGPPVEP